MNGTLHDNEIREPLFDYLEEIYGKIRIIEEKTMGKSRADIVMVRPDRLCGIEIKSDADTYARLSRQVKDYDKFFDENIVVVGSSHALHIEEHVPEYWGIITVEEVDDALDFYELRKPRPNPKAELAKKLSILWRPELFKLQQWAEMPKYKEKRKEFVIEKILERIPDEKSDPSEKKLPKNPIYPELLHLKISELLFERDYTTVEEDLKEYRKSDLKKALETETDPQRRLELMVEQAERSRNLIPRKKRRHRRRK